MNRPSGPLNLFAGALYVFLYAPIVVVIVYSFNVARFGAEFPRFSPRQADLLIVVGTITERQAPVLRRIYDQMPEPKWVISMGACASAGGVFDNYAIVQGVDQVVPVDVFVPGCPPRPEALIYGIVQLQRKIDRERAFNR